MANAIKNFHFVFEPFPNVWHEASQGRARRGVREERKLAGIL